VKRNSILLIESQETLYWDIFRILNREKLKLVFRKKEDEIINILNKGKIDCIILNLDKKLYSSSVPQLLSNLSKSTPVIIISDKNLFAEYSAKYKSLAWFSGVGDGKKLISVISIALEQNSARVVSKNLPLPKNRNTVKNNMMSIKKYLGKNREAENVIFAIKEFKDNDCPVLIYGDRGTRQELVARFIHECGLKRENIVTIDLEEIPTEFVYAEIFGSENNGRLIKKGIIELVDGGTLLLKNISSIPCNLQECILDFIETGQFSRDNADFQIRADVRLIATSCDNLSEEVEMGLFSKELYDVFEDNKISLMPLDKKRGNIRTLAEKYVSSIALTANKKIHISLEALDYLSKREWNGNDKEFYQFIKRGILLSSKSKREGLKREKKIDVLVELEDLVMDSNNYEDYCLSEILREDSTFAEVIEETVNNLEGSIISKILIRTAKNKVKAAELLRIDYSTLFRKIKKYKIFDT